MSESILIVDDEQSVRRMLHGLFQGMNYAVSEADSADQALKRVEQVPVDVVITDMKMPGMDGLTLSRELLKQDPDRPVLLMTAYADLESARKAVNIGIYEYFTKPFDMNDVASGVRRAMERRRLLLENRAYQKDLERKVEERTRELQQRLHELEARDRLLRTLLSLQDPNETLALAVRLALDLCACDVGAIYALDNHGKLVLRAAVGFQEAEEPAHPEVLKQIGREGMPEIEQALWETLRNQIPTWMREPGDFRKKWNIHSFGILPVCRRDDAIAVLEVGRKRKDTLVGESDLEALQGFLPYVAMAVVECKLQEEIPEWAGDVEEIFKATEKWSE